MTTAFSDAAEKSSTTQASAAAPQATGNDQPKKTHVRRNGEATRRKLLDGACAIILEEGTDKLTIERVISRAGVSKGTFLYHFPTRDRLVEALVNEYAKHLEVVMTSVEAASADDLDPVLGGYERWYRDFSSGEIDGGSSPLVSLVTASRSNRRYMEPVREWYRNHFAKLEHSPCGPETALLVSLAYDALFFHHLFGTDVLDPKAKAKLIDVMHKLSQGEARIEDSRDQKNGEKLAAAS